MWVYNDYPDWMPSGVVVAGLASTVLGVMYLYRDKALKKQDYLLCGLYPALYGAYLIYTMQKLIDKNPKKLKSGDFAIGGMLVYVDFIDEIFGLIRRGRIPGLGGS